MSTGLDSYIEERADGWYFGIEKWERNGPDAEYNEEGPFATIEALRRAYDRHPNPGGFSVDCKDHDAFMAEWNAAGRRR